MDTNSCDMPDDSNVALFWTVGGVVGPHGDRTKSLRVCCYGNFGDKNHRFYLPARVPRGAIAFSGT